MKQILIRTQVIPALNSKVFLNGCTTYHIPIELPQTADSVLKNTVGEPLPFHTLLQEYRREMQHRDSAAFARMYQLGPTCGLVIDQNIYFYHTDVCPVRVTWKDIEWAYMSSKKYIGDSWWFDDAEILKDVQQMPLPAFLEKYKGY